MSDDTDVQIGEQVAGQRHFPRYTEGCWGKPGHKLCWLCKVRVPLALVRLLNPLDE